MPPAVGKSIEDRDAREKNLRRGFDELTSDPQGREEGGAVNAQTKPKRREFKKGDHVIFDEDTTAVVIAVYNDRVWIGEVHYPRSPPTDFVTHASRLRHAEEVLTPPRQGAGAGRHH
jgi:hypothetical protein